MAFDLLQTVQVVGGPVAGALTGATAGWLLGRKNAAAHVAADQTDAITRRFKTLLDGYESRIKDLVAEVARLRGLIVEMQQLTRR